MNFAFTKEQLEIREKARTFAQEYVKEGAQERDRTEEFPMHLIKKLGEEGLIGVQFPTAYGGHGMDFLSFILIVEELCKVDSAFGIAYAISSTFTTGLFSFGTESQKKEVLPRLFSGDALGCFALTEPDVGSDAGAVKTTAVLEGDEYVINGKKRYITNGPLAEYAMVVASTDPSQGARGLSAFLVKLKEDKGVSIGHIENKCGINSAKVSEILFENVRIPKDRLIGEHGRGLNYALSALNAGRLGVAAQGLALAEAAFEHCREHIMKREQFGKPIYKNQYISFRMADLSCEIDMARLLLYKAVWKQQNGENFSVDAAKAKLCCTNTAMHVTTECVQMMGGAGYMRENDVERMFRDAKITQIYEGTNEIQRLIITKSLF